MNWTGMVASVTTTKPVDTTAYSTDTTSHSSSTSIDSTTKVPEFTKLGNSHLMLVHAPGNPEGCSIKFWFRPGLTYYQGKSMCAKLDATLPELWNEQEWNEVLFVDRNQCAINTALFHFCMFFYFYRNIFMNFFIVLQMRDALSRVNVFGHFFIGLTDLEKEGEFVWDSGRPLSDSGASHWDEGYPNNHWMHYVNLRSPANCVKIIVDRFRLDTWIYDTACNSSSNSVSRLVCEKRN